MRWHEKLERLKQILRGYGFRILRLRHFENRARIEVGFEELPRLSENSLREEIFSKIRGLGFETVEADPEGYRQGKLNPI